MPCQPLVSPQCDLVFPALKVHKTSEKAHKGLWVSLTIRHSNGLISEHETASCLVRMSSFHNEARSITTSAFIRSPCIAVQIVMHRPSFVIYGHVVLGPLPCGPLSWAQS